MIAIDMDNKAFVLERAVQKAATQPQVRVSRCHVGSVSRGVMLMSERTENGSAS